MPAVEVGACASSLSMAESAVERHASNLERLSIIFVIISSNSSSFFVRSSMAVVMAVSNLVGLRDGARMTGRTLGKNILVEFVARVGIDGSGYQLLGSLIAGEGD